MNKNELIHVYRTDTEITNENFSELNELNIAYTKVTDRIKKNIDNVFNNFLDIAALLHEAKITEVYKWVDYKDIYEYAQNEFDLGKTSVKNYIQIAEKCLIESSENENLKTGVLLEQYKDYNYSQLVELLTVDKLDLDKYNPEMSVRQIRQNKYEESYQKYIKSLSDLDDENSEINKIIDSLIETFDNNYPEESIRYNRLNWGLMNLRFYMDKYDFLLEFYISKQYDGSINFTIRADEYKYFKNINEALEFSKEQILLQAKKRIQERQEKEIGQTSDQEVENIDDHVEGQTSDQENETVEVVSFRTGTWQEFLDESDFTDEASTYLIETIASTFSACNFEWYPDNCDLKICLNDEHYLLLNYENDVNWDEHRLDFSIKLMDSEDNSLIKEYTINSLFKQILMEFGQ